MKPHRQTNGLDRLNSVQERIPFSNRHTLFFFVFFHTVVKNMNESMVQVAKLVSVFENAVASENKGHLQCLNYFQNIKINPKYK